MASNEIHLIRVDDTLKTEVSEEEKKFRQEKFSDEKIILKKNPSCTACGKDIRDRIVLRYQVNVHPVLEVLWCKECEDFYGDGNFSLDEDGSDKYCRWCAQGGQLYCCSYCSIAFCAVCVKRNFSRKILREIEDDDWRCFVCVTEPLWTLRAICDAAKRYAEKHLKSRKSRRSLKIDESGDDTAETVDSEASGTRSSRRRRNEKPTASSENTESEENVFVAANKSKRKRASSSEESVSKTIGKRSKSRNEETVADPNAEKKKIFKDLVVEVVKDFGIFRKILAKKEATLKKDYLGPDVTDEIILQAEQDVQKICQDAIKSMEIIDRKIADQLRTLRVTAEDNEIVTQPESPSKDPLASSVESEDEPKQDANSADITAVNGKAEDVDNDMSLTIMSDDEKLEENSKSTRSVNDSLAVNISSIIESLKTDDDTRLTDKPAGFDDTTIIEDVEMADVTQPITLSNDNLSEQPDASCSKESPKIDNSVTESTQIDNSAVESPKADESIAESPRANKSASESPAIDNSIADSPLSKDKVSKMALLQSSSDNASSSDNDGAKAKSSDSDLSGVSVLPSEAETTKRKKKKTRRELDKLGAKSAAKKGLGEDDEDTEINRLTNLNSLKKRKKCNTSSDNVNSDSDTGKGEKANSDVEKEKSVVSGSENSPREVNCSKKAENEQSKSDDSRKKETPKRKKNLSSSEKKNRKSTVLDYFSGSGADSDASNVSFSKFNSFIENKHKAFLNGNEDLSKKCLLGFSSDDELSENHDESKISTKKSPKKEKSVKKAIIITSEEEPEKDDDAKNPKKNDKAKWRSDPLLKRKLSETDTSDEERMIQRERQRRLKEAEKPANKSSSDSEDLFRSKKLETSTKKRKAKLASSGSEFEIGKAEESDDSVQIISEDEKPVSRNKKRRRIKKFDDSDSSDDEKKKDKDAPGSASKGRKNIRKMLTEDDLAELTVKTAKEESERKKRIAERQALFNESFKIDESLDKQLNQLVLDFDPETKKELVSVHPTLIKKLKPHQAKGVKFMWDSCFESVKMTQTTPGGGCILAHCMGLGKTLQVITLVHTVMRYPELNINRVLIICPLSTVLNWVAEFDMWLRDVEYGDDINVFHLKKTSNNVLRADYLNNWFKEGGIMVLGYEMFRNLINGTKTKKKIKEYFLQSLLDPGPDLVVCDEGHMLKNEVSALSQATMKIKTRRRVVLTGTPLQNNLKEYHCMVQFVKPNLLGDKKEFLNRFANPITNGQYNDSTSHDVRVMKRRAHVLHKMLDGVVQRFDYNVLTPFLPAKHEFVIMVALSDLQAKLYQYYIDNFSKKAHPQSKLFKDYQTMRLIWTHPLAMKLGEERRRKIEEKKDYDSEGSLKDFVVDSSEDSANDSDSQKSDDSVVSIRSGDDKKPKASKKHLTRAKRKELGIIDEEPIDLENEDSGPAVWWKSMINEEEMDDYRMGPKIILLFAILKQCENIGDKLLVFSQSIPSLDMIEYFLDKWDTIQDKGEKSEQSDGIGTWVKGADYFRLDGQTAPELRTMYCNSFNKATNMRARLFLISTKAGGLGINLTAANRVVIFDASWNPSYDVQSIFRIYRFGQSKPCYIYRFLSQGTMEEKIYERQVTKLSISCRVVDEQQIDRHFSNTDVDALYEFNRKTPSTDEIPKLPKDRLMAELLKEYKDIILGYLEHDSLLENIAEEELTEEERKQAWEDYENEKKGLNMNIQNQLTMTPAQADIFFKKDIIMTALRREHPNVGDDQLLVMYNMVRKKLTDHYVEQMQLQHIQKLQQMRAGQTAQVANQPNKPVDPLAPQKHAAYVQNLQIRNLLDQQAKERLEQADHLKPSVSQK